MPTEGLEPPLPGYKTDTLPIKQNRRLNQLLQSLKNLF